jgi:DNA invertase Pin-like site-specific DNA recombinase
MKAAVYLRQSQDRNGDELAISRQRDDCLALCKQKGWQPTEYVDNDRSASNGKPRPAYERLLADIRAGKVDAVVVWDLDRLHRRPIELEEFINLADEKHLALATVTGECDLSTHNGRLYARIKGAVARAEMDQKSARQRRAAEQRAESGTQWWSARPFGFAYADGRPVLDADGKPTLDPKEARAIREAYSAVLTGVSLYRITADWNERGVVTPRGNRWRGSQVRQLLCSPRNAGLRTFRKQVVGAGGWPAIVDREVWQGVADRLADPGRRYGPSRARRHLLSNIARCGACGAGLGSGVNSRGGLIYCCKACNRVSRNGAWLDAIAIEAVVARLSRADAIELVQPEERDDLGELHERARALRARLDALATEFADGELTPSQLKTATARIREQLAAIDAAILDAQATHVFDGVLGADDVAAAFDGLSLDRQRAVIDAVVAITVNPSGRCGRVLKREDVDVRFHQRAA